MTGKRKQGHGIRKDTPRAIPAASTIACMSYRAAPQAGHDLADLSIAVAAGLALAFTALFLCAVPLAGNLAGSRDFVAYWATGHQLAAHANPYDRDAIQRIEHSAGLTDKAVLMMRNPPWALPLAYPLGFVGLRIAAVAWSLMLLGCLLVSVLMVRRMHGSPANRLHWLGLAFTPALICLIMGQTSLLALLGLVLFLRFNRSRPLAAGAALWLCALKPQLFLPFAAALAVWIAVTRSYKLLAGAAGAIALSSAAAFFIAPSAWRDYAGMMRSPAVENEFIPCLADALRHWLLPQAAWVQYLPAALGCVWAVVYYWRRRAQWDWLTNGSPLMLVSLLVAPYCWFYDQCLAIPAVMHGAYATRSRKLLTALSVMILLTLIQLCGVKVVSPLWLWPAPAWFAWYVFARAAGGHEAARSEPDLPLV